MTPEIKAGTILIKQGTPLPEGLLLESEPYLDGWRVVTDFDGYRLDREIRKNGWTFFCLAGELKAGVFGMNPRNMVRRAIERMLARAQSSHFNSLEITRVISSGSERFAVVRYVTVSAQTRHIQESVFLGRPNSAARIETAKPETPVGGQVLHDGPPLWARL